jgi:hypothetical protein
MPPPLPASPLGRPKFKMGFSAVPVIVAVAFAPVAKVVTVPIVKFGVAPVSPLTAEAVSEYSHC